MPRTRSDLIVRVLGLLGITETGQDPSAEDVELVDGYVDGKFAELARRRVFYVQADATIDDEAFLPLAKIVANAVAPEFGLPFDPNTDVREEARLREMQLEPGINDVIRAEYF